MEETTSSQVDWLYNPVSDGFGLSVSFAFPFIFEQVK